MLKHVGAAMGRHVGVAMGRHVGAAMGRQTDLVLDASLPKHKNLLSQSALVFPQFWVFEAIFEARRQNLPIFKNFICTFYCTQNDRLDPTVSMQKSV